MVFKCLLHQNHDVLGLLPDTELFKKMFSTILDVINASKAQKNIFKLVRKIA